MRSGSAGSRKPTRSMKRRGFLWLLAAWVLLLVAPIAVQTVVTKPRLEEQERHISRNEMRKTLGYFAQRRERLEQLAQSLSSRQDLYEYVAAVGDSPEADHVEQQLRHAGLHFVHVYDQQGIAIYAQAFDPRTQQPAPSAEVAPEQLRQRLPQLGTRDANGLIDGRSHSGNLRLSDGRLVTLITYPIQGENPLATTVGTLVTGQIESQNDLDLLDAQLGITVKLLDPMPGHLPSDDAPQIDPQSLTVVTSALILDPFGAPIARLELTLPALIIQDGRRILLTATLSNLALVTVLFAMLVFGLERSVAAPLRKLVDLIHDIQRTGSLKGRVQMNRNDELEVLAQDFNEMLALLEERSERLEQQANVDELTTLWSRRWIMAHLTDEVERAGRYPQCFSVLLLDIDHFKRINDTLGHAVGDRVLRQIAQILKNTLRASDKAGRYGGEEFLVVLPEQNEVQAMAAAERVRAAVATTLQPDVPWSVTVSIGVAEWNNHTKETLLFVADKNLYRAKTGGRNQVVGGAVPKSMLPAPSVTRLRLPSGTPAAKG